eukprot:g2245.t1
MLNRKMQRKRHRLGPDELFANFDFPDEDGQTMISSTPTDYATAATAGLFINEAPMQNRRLSSYQDTGPSFMGFLASSHTSTEDSLEPDGNGQIHSGDELSRTESVHEASLPNYDQSFQNQLMSAFNMSSPFDTDFQIDGIQSLDNTRRMPQEARELVRGHEQSATTHGLRLSSLNNEQEQLLERYFQLGFIQLTPGMVQAVQELGETNEHQIAVWLAIRLAHHQQFMNRELYNNEEHNEIKRRKERNEQSLQDFTTMIFSVTNELDLILRHVDVSGITCLCRSIMKAPQIVCYGISKEGCIMNRFASDLNRLGFYSNSLSDVGTLPVAPGDLFIVSAGPSCYSSVSSLALEARRMGAYVVAFTAHKTAGMLFTETFIQIPAQTLTPFLNDHHELSRSSPEIVSFLPEGLESVMNLGSSYEVGLSTVHASIITMLRRALMRSLSLK